MKPQKASHRADLRESERSLRSDLADVRDVVLDLNRQEAELRDERNHNRARQKETRIKRQRLAATIERRRAASPSDAGRGKKPDVRLDKRLEALHHRSTRLKKAERDLDKKLDRLDQERRPFVETQKRLLGQIERNVASQHGLHFEPPGAKVRVSPERQAFARSSAINNQPTTAGRQSVASAKRLDELKKRTDRPKPAPELKPPGMSGRGPDRSNDNRGVDKEIARIEKAIAARRGQARGGFKRSAGG